MTGYDRQQYCMFQADRYTSANLIGFADDDAVFTTPVLESDLME